MRGPVAKSRDTAPTIPRYRYVKFVVGCWCFVKCVRTPESLCTSMSGLGVTVLGVMTLFLPLPDNGRCVCPGDRLLLLDVAMNDAQGAKGRSGDCGGLFC